MWPIVSNMDRESGIFVMLPHRVLYLGSVLVFGAMYHGRSSLAMYFGCEPRKERREGVLKMQRNGDCLTWGLKGGVYSLDGDPLTMELYMPEFRT